MIVSVFDREKKVTQCNIKIGQIDGSIERIAGNIFSVLFWRALDLISAPRSVKWVNNIRLFRLPNNPDIEEGVLVEQNLRTSHGNYVIFDRNDPYGNMILSNGIENTLEKAGISHNQEACEVCPVREWCPLAAIIQKSQASLIV